MENRDIPHDDVSSPPRDDLSSPLPDEVSSPPRDDAPSASHDAAPSPPHDEVLSPPQDAPPPAGATSGPARQAAQGPAVTLITPEGRAARAAAPGSQSGVFALVETALKLAAAGLALVAAMGFPAVYLHFSRFNIPAHLASYDHVLRAGILPATLLLFVGTYVYWGAQAYQSKRPKSRFHYVPLVIFSPLMFVSATLMFVGSIALLLLYIWGIFWLFAWPVARMVGSPIPSRALLYAAAAAIALGGVVYLLSRLRALQRTRFFGWVNETFSEKPSARREARAAERAERRSESPPTAGTKAGVEDDPGKVLLWMLPLLIIMCVGMAYAIKGVFYVWDAGLSSPFLGHRFLLSFGLGCGAAYAVFVFVIVASSWAKSDDKRLRFRGFATLMGIPLLIFLTSVTLYSYSFYARLPRGLGGGRPDRIVVWFARADFPEDLQGRLARAACAGDEKTVRCENVYLLYDDADVFVVGDAPAPPAAGALLPRDKVKAVSWPPGG